MPHLTTAKCTRLVIGPNASMGAPQAAAFFTAVALPCLGTAGVLAGMGYWPVLPFAGLELVAVGAALVVALRHNRYREWMWFGDERLRIECGRQGRDAEVVRDWPRTHTRAWLEPGRGGNSRLVLACGHQQLAVGECLTEAERRRLARRIRELITPAWAPAGGAGSLA